MKEKFTIFDFLAKVMVVFGFSTIVLNVFCIAFGDSARGFSSMFELGGQGISVKTSFQYLAVSVLIEGAEFIFFTDKFIKKMEIWLRTICMLGTVLLIISSFIIIFGWFPLTMLEPWVMFFICFVISFIASTFVMRLKEKMENKKLNEALERMKKKEKQTK